MKSSARWVLFGDTSSAVHAAHTIPNLHASRQDDSRNPSYRGTDATAEGPDRGSAQRRHSAASHIHRPVTLHQLWTAVEQAKESAGHRTREGSRLGECTLSMPAHPAVGLSRVWCCGRVVWWRLVQPFHGRSGAALLVVLSDNTGVAAILHHPLRSCADLKAEEEEEAEEEENRKEEESLDTNGIEEERDVPQPQPWLRPSTITLEDLPQLEKLYVSFRGRLVLADAEPRLAKVFDVAQYPELRPLLLRPPRHHPAVNASHRRGQTECRDGVAGGVSTEMVWLPGAGEAISREALKAIGVVGAPWSASPPTSFSSSQEDQTTAAAYGDCSSPPARCNVKPNELTSTTIPLFCLKGCLEVLESSNEQLFHQISAVHLHQYLQRRYKSEG